MTDASTDIGSPNPNNFLSSVPFQTVIISVFALVVIFFIIHLLYKKIV